MIALLDDGDDVALHRARRVDQHRRPGAAGAERLAAELAVVEVGGVSRTFCLALAPEARIYDYVLLHAGYAIGIVDEEEAMESLKLFKEMAAFEEKSNPGKESGS
jgi:hydrogenase expression/formation protein HypC